ncbi:LEF-11 [Rachiplusia nu nucleopolyhedrovirus]|uniref:Late expression factor 11 n=1 Tax=Rachiplusia nu nucleopolyhedrovirus TaxID=2605775 RepID=A0AAE6M5P9_9ABAC|nr:LEF-11 [Rachiplusia nu nucleopolyhedrovirus]QEI03651.1 LEF-11 [Rachiplusia nu nucleopolyhedrovirus]
MERTGQWRGVGGQQIQSSQLQQPKEYLQRQSLFSDRARTQEHSQCCLTRSEFYALVRETINKRKHERDVHNVCEHIFSKGFVTQIDYIRNKLDKALITVGGQQRQCKRLSNHVRKINNLFKLNKSLRIEYQETLSRYDSSRQEQSTVERQRY